MNIANTLSKSVLRRFSGSVIALAILFGVALAATPLRAQQQGPIGPPPASSDSSGSPVMVNHGSAIRWNAAERTPSRPSPASRRLFRPIRSSQKFSQHESEFRTERDNYTYTQTFVFQTLDFDNNPDGEYRLTTDVSFTPEGKRYEHDTYAPAPTITKLLFTKQDLDDLKNIQPFVLTTEELPKYNVTYVGRQMVDEIHTYVFEVAPKKIEKNERYFQGRVWVDDHDLQIVKSYGKAVPDIIKKNNENIFPHFETVRENITALIGSDLHARR